MTLEAYVTLGTLPVYLSILGMYALAVWLMYLAPGKRAHQSFAVVLFLWATAVLAQTLLDVTGQEPLVGSSGSSAGFSAVTVVCASLFPLALAWFLSVYPSERGPLSTRRGRWSLFAAGLLVVGLYLWDPGLWARNLWGPGGAFLRELSEGPLQLLVNIGVAGIGFAGFWLAREHARTEPSRNRRSVLLVALGFLLYGLHRSLLSVLDLLRSGTLPPDFFRLDLPHMLAFPLVLWGAWLLYREAGPDPDQRRSTRAVLLVLYAAALTLGGVREFASLPRFVTLGVVTLSFPLLGAYALLRHQLFGVDLTVNWTVKQSTVAGIFVAVFFAASEGAQVLFADFAGSEFVGVGVAALLVFALAPLQRIGEQVADAAVPTEQAAAAAGTGSPEETYRQLVEQAWADGALERSERGLLDRARDSLGLDRETAARIEEEVIAADA